jgi:hypothetical protein
VYGLLIMLIAAFEPAGLVGIARRFTRRSARPGPTAGSAARW